MKTILGSCVSRDIWSVANAPFGGRYFARTSLASLMSPAVGLDEDDLAALTSPFQRRSVLEDAARTPLAFIAETQPPAIVLDFVDDRFDLMEVQEGRYLLNSFELHGSRAVGMLFPRARRIERLSDECFAIWEDAAVRFMDEVASRAPRTKIILHRAFLQTHMRTADGTVSAWPDQVSVVGRSAPIRDLNTMLSRYYAKVIYLGDVQVLDASPENQISGIEHQWGPHPVHYVREYYLDCHSQLPEEMR